jgi:hypothetical protein
VRVRWLKLATGAVALALIAAIWLTPLDQALAS